MIIKYVYILIYTDMDGTKALCKADIDLNRLLLWGCRAANRHPDHRYMVLKQPLTYDGKITIDKEIFPSKKYIN